MFRGVAQHFRAQQLVAAMEAASLFELLFPVGPAAAQIDLAVV
jgi:hypothetical protein